jgi:hypothetical protein
MPRRSARIGHDTDAWYFDLATVGVTRECQERPLRDFCEPYRIMRQYDGGLSRPRFGEQAAGFRSHYVSIRHADNIDVSLLERECPPLVIENNDILFS